MQYLSFIFLFVTIALPIGSAAASPDNTQIPETTLEIILTPPGNSYADNLLETHAQTWKGRHGKGIRSRKIDVNPEAQKRKRRSSDEQLSLQLFADAKIDAQVVQSLIDINGTTTTTAKIANSTWGRVFMASSNGRVHVKINDPENGKFYAIQYNTADDAHYALELDPERVQYDGLGIPIPEDSISETDNWNLPEIAEDPSAAPANTEVDVMVVYSNDALADAGGKTGIDTIIALGIEFGNDAHTNSNTGIYLNLVHSELVNYTGSNNRGTDLDRLTFKNDGYLEEVHTLRDAYGADYVVLLVGNYSSNGGIAWVLQSTNGSPNYAFSVVTLPAFDTYTTVHEIGHNMGLSHAKDQNFQAGPTDWYYDTHGFGDTTAGWHWHPTPSSKGYCSVMTYTGGGYFPDGLAHWRVGYFSDPNISRNGYPTGHATNGDSARVLRALKNVYASYRDRPAPPATIMVTYPNGGENLTAGSNANIQWDSSNLSGNVKIDLYRNNSFNRVISSSTANDGMFNWSIPDSPTGSNFTIRISDLPDTVADESNSDFNIAGVPANAPEVATLTAKSITLNSAELNGSIADLGTSDPHAHGFMWSMDANPDFSDNVIDLGASSTAGDFSYSLGGLESATTYYIRAYATNSSGTGFGDIIEINTARKDMTCFPVRSKTGQISIICF